MNPLFTEKPVPLEKLQEALDELNNSLKKFTEKFLQDKPFTMGSEISLADLVAIVELMEAPSSRCSIDQHSPASLQRADQLFREQGKQLMLPFSSSMPVGSGCNIFESWPELAAWHSQMKESAGEELFQEAHKQILNTQNLRNIQVDPQMKV
ncbi:glutathione S-transferase theta-1-like [Pelodiscus sinensis]|uniref:glutathione S-transferase theta-1-like n=1 Tax=Pelodiscus sinensis TaxID=13735 RepID=UPI003F6AAEF0